MKAYSSITMPDPDYFEDENLRDELEVKVEDIKKLQKIFKKVRARHRQDKAQAQELKQKALKDPSLCFCGQPGTQ